MKLTAAEVGDAGGDAGGASQPSLPLERITGVESSIDASPAGLENLLSTIIGFMTIAGGITFLLWILIGAYTWITAGGQPEKIEKARSHITNAITGLVILIGAVALTGLISALLGLDVFNFADQIDNLLPGSSETSP